MIGEIRDFETAEIAIQAALSGHLVFSTLHTNDALSSFIRLIDMGVEPFLAAAPVKGVQAQRLVRKVCEVCALPGDPPKILDAHAEILGDRLDAKWARKGCKSCQFTGYHGRLGIYELFR